MKRIGFVFKVQQEKIAEYKAHHEHVWPDMLDALHRNGWHNYSLFMRSDGLLFGYFEAPVDFATALAGMDQEGANLRWQEFMKPYFDLMDAARPDQAMLELEEVFHLD